MTNAKVEHESFGVIRINKGHYVSLGEKIENRKPLFGSSILHDSFVSISIQRATLERDLNRDLIFPSNYPPIVEVQMSATQFADAITSFGKGEGTPCTITFANGKEILGLRFQNKRVQFDAEFAETITEIASENNPFYAEIERILLKSSLGKHDRAEIKMQLHLLRQEIKSNIPFIKEQFTEQMDHTVLEAKNEVEAFIEGKLRGVGLENFKKELMKLREDAIPSLEVKTEESV